jgi:hypothetical protein
MIAKKYRRALFDTLCFCFPLCIRGLWLQIRQVTTCRYTLCFCFSLCIRGLSLQSLALFLFPTLYMGSIQILKTNYFN